MGKRREQPTDAAGRIGAEVLEPWFLREPALHSVACSHELRANGNLRTPMRSGAGRIEYNPDMVEQLTPLQLEETMRAEVVRIMLKHPYQRQPDARPSTRLKASNMVLTSNYSFSDIKLDSPSDYRLRRGEAFEWYANRLKPLEPKQEALNETPPPDDNPDDDTPQQTEGTGPTPEQKPDQDSRKSGDDGGQNGAPRPADSGGRRQNETGKEQNGGRREESEGEDEEQEPTDKPDNRPTPQDDGTAADEQAALWEEDEWRMSQLNEIIERIRDWGTLAGDLQGLIEASTRPRIDYRRVLSGFRASVISSKRKLTRMRPNRRTDFANMGSVYNMVTNLLVATDCSGSVDDAELSLFYGVVNKFFKYGIERIDVVQFDTVIHGEPTPLRKAMRGKIKVVGRGGTNVQPVFDMMADHKEYDGLIVLTDGYFALPQIEGRRPRVLFVLTSQEAYRDTHAELEKIGRACVIET